MTTTLRGILPPMTTPFREDGTLDLDRVEAQVEFLLAAGVHGLVAGGSNGEGHALGADELQQLISRTARALNGRAPLVAGVIVNSTREAIARGRAVADLGVAALQVTPVHYLFRPDDDSTVEHFRAVAEGTGLPVIIYNVVPWTYLSPALLGRIMREVPGVVGVKQSAGDLKLLADLLVAARPEDRIFTAIDALLYPSYALGACGAIAAILAAAPRACVELWDAVEASDHERALERHAWLLRLWNAIAGDNLPACVKHAQTHQGCAAGQPRAPMPAATAAQRRAIEGALEAA